MVRKGMSSFEERTDTHLSKLYNYVLAGCIDRSTKMGALLSAFPHIENLHKRYAAVYSLYENCFMLFTQIPAISPFNNLSEELIARMELVSKNMKLMRRSQQYQNSPLFEEMVEQCNTMHMKIMYGLQRRQMLVRTSEKELTGADSVRLWETKVSFKKGGFQAITNRNKMLNIVKGE